MRGQAKSAPAERHSRLEYGYYSIVAHHGKCDPVKNGNTFMKN